VSPAEAESWTVAYDVAVDAVRAAQACIQALAVLTEGDADMKLCFAGGSLHGVQALLREADAVHRQLALPMPKATP
jgi:hypothetical protein